MAFSENRRAYFTEQIKFELDRIPTKDINGFDLIISGLGKILNLEDERSIDDSVLEAVASVNVRPYISPPPSYLLKEEIAEYQQIVSDLIFEKISEFKSPGFV